MNVNYYIAIHLYKYIYYYIIHSYKYNSTENGENGENFGEQLYKTRKWRKDEGVR